MHGINEINAAFYGDNFTILTPTGDLVGCEHNQTEAEAIVRWLNGERGGGYTLRRNNREEVRASKAIRGDVVRFEIRDEIFRDMQIV